MNQRIERGGSASDHAYETLRSMVLELELAPGAPLAETEVSERLGVSRTPIREALGRLAREGLVRQHPGRGAFVSEISVPDLVELYQMREALESHAVRLAAETVDEHGRQTLREISEALELEREALERGETDSYYRLIARLDEAVVQMANNKRLANALVETWAQISRARRVASRSPSRMLATVDEHISLITAISDGDDERAAKEVRVHVRRSLANITASLNSSSFA